MMKGFTWATTRELKRILHGLVVPFILVATWEFGTRIGFLPKSLVSTPADVVADLIRLSSDGTLVRHSLASLMRLFVGFLIGSVLGVALGTIVGLSKAIERYVAPSIAFLSPVPVSAWIPLVIILFGIGDMAKSYLISIGTFFVVYASTFSGIRNADYKLIEMAKLLNKTRFTLAINILLPSALPMILHGLRGALALGWILLIVAEVVASTTGLGWLIWDSRNFARADDMVAGMIVVGAFGAITDYVMSLIQARLLFWRKTFDGV